MQNHKIPANIIQLGAALAALGAYNGENTESEHTEEAERLGGDKEYYRMRLVNSLLGIVETEAMNSETSSKSAQELFDAHQQALQSAGAMRNNEILLGFLRRRTLRIAGPLRQIAQDETTGPVPLAAAHAADGLQRLLAIVAAGQNIDPAMLSPDEIKADINNAKESLSYAIANLDILLKLITEVEE